MANREQKRKLEKKNNKKKVVKKEEKKRSFFTDKLGLTEDMASFVKTLLIVVVSFLIILILSLVLGRLGVFDKGYTKPESTETVISYDEIIAGTVFTESDNEYYVVFDTFGDKTADLFLSSKISSYTGNIHIYKVDMTKSVNKKFASENGNSTASKSSELQINGPTLIKILDGRNVLYIEGTENIVNELSK